MVLIYFIFFFKNFFFFINWKINFNKFQENKLGYEGCQALHDGLKDNTNLIELDLASNFFFFLLKTF